MLTNRNFTVTDALRLMAKNGRLDGVRFLVNEGVDKDESDDGDEFNLAEGERIAFEKATDKRCQYFSNLVIRITNELFTQERSDDYSLSKKFEREQKKFYECKELTPEEKGEYIPNMIDQADEIVEELKETLKIIKAEKNKIKD